MQDGGYPDELQLGDYVAILRQRWLWVAVPLLLMPTLAYAFAATRPDQFTARAEVLLGETAAQEAIAATNQNASYRSRVLENELSLALSDEAFREVADRFAADVDSAPRAVVTTDDTSDVLIFTANSQNPRSAADTANAWAETYVDLKRSQTEDSIGGAIEQLETRLIDLQTARDELRRGLTELEDQLVDADVDSRDRAQLLVDREQSRISGRLALIDAQIDAIVSSINVLQLSGELALSGSARVVRSANVPVRPTNAPLSRSVLLGLIVGALLGAGLAIGREKLDRAVRTEQDLEDAGVIFLGSVPRSEKSLSEHALSTVVDQTGSEAEASQKIQTAVQFLAISQGVSSIVVTSARQGDGKTTTASNLAIAMARAGRRTLLVDSDLRRPRLHKVFDLDQAPGLTGIALNTCEIVEAARAVREVSDTLVVIPAGGLPPHPAGFMSSRPFGDTVDNLEELADITIFDAAPVLPVADTLSLVSHVDGAIIVVHAGQTTKQDLAETIDSLTSAGGRILGAILVGVKRSSSAYKYEYDSDDQKLVRLAESDLSPPSDPTTATATLNGSGGNSHDPSSLSSVES